MYGEKSVCITSFMCPLVNELSLTSLRPLGAEKSLRGESDPGLTRPLLRAIGAVSSAGQRRPAVPRSCAERAGSAELPAGRPQLAGRRAVCIGMECRRSARGVAGRRKSERPAIRYVGIFFNF